MTMMKIIPIAIPALTPVESPVLAEPPEWAVLLLADIATVPEDKVASPCIDPVLVLEALLDFVTTAACKSVESFTLP
jgi:hypothetical protein